VHYLCKLLIYTVTKLAPQVHLTWMHQLKDSPPPRFDLFSGVTGVKMYS